VAFLQGNLMLYPLLPPGAGETLALTTAAGLLRSWGWFVPDDLVVFGGDGSNDLLDSGFRLTVPHVTSSCR